MAKEAIDAIYTALADFRRKGAEIQRDQEEMEAELSSCTKCSVQGLAEDEVYDFETSGEVYCLDCYNTEWEDMVREGGSPTGAVGPYRTRDEIIDEEYWQ